MGKVTYAIGFRNELPYQNEVKQQRRLYNGLREKGHSLPAAEAARQLAETLLDQGDELIAMNDSIKAQRKSLESALAYCDEARNIFNEFDNQKERISVDLLRIKCLQSLKDYQEALNDCQQLESFVQHHLAEEHSIQQELYKSYADLYFNRGADEQRSNCYDFLRAKHYYELERETLHNLEAGQGYEDKEELQDLIRANTFNLGVIESKVGGDLTLAVNLLKKSIEHARGLADLQNERNAWWELGNIYKIQRDFKNALECQSNELKLAQLDDLQETELLCLYDIATTRLEMNSYADCKEIENDIMELANDRSYAESLINPLESIRVNAIKAEESEKMESSDSINKAKVYMMLAKTYHQALMNDKALQSLEKGSLCLNQVQDSDAVSLTLKADGLILKGDLKWQTKKAVMEELIAPYLDALLLMESASSTLTQNYILDVKKACMEKLIRIHDYFDAFEERDKWTLELENIHNSEDSTMGRVDGYFSSSEEEFQPNEPLPNDAAGSQQIPILIDEGGNSHTDHPMVIEVEVVDPNQKRKLLIPWNDHINTVQWLSDEVTNRCWMAFGIWPKFDHLETRGARMFPNDMLAHIFSEDGSFVSAVVQAYEQKPLEDIYLNACYRLNCSPDDDIKAQLRLSNGQHISLNGMGITLDEIIPLAETIVHSESLQTLCLSGNFLDDLAITSLLSSHDGQSKPIMPNLRTLNVASNYLTAASFKNFVDSLSPALETLNLSHNPIGSEAILILPNAASKFPNLRSICLDNCDIGVGEVQTGRLTRNAGEENSEARYGGLCVSLANNRIESNTRETLHAALVLLPRLEMLNYSRITPVLSNSPFDSLLLLSSLRKLDVSNTLLGDDGVNCLFNLVKGTTSLNSLNVSYCGINTLHMKLLSQALQENSSLREIVMTGNKLETAGVQAFMDCARGNSRQILDIIHLNDCSITAEIYEIASFTRHFRYMDISQNVAIDSNADLEYLLGVMLEEPGSEEVIVDACVNEVDIERISQTRPDIWGDHHICNVPYTDALLRKAFLTMVQSASPGIGLLGSTALLVSSITGPGLTTISLMFQQSGWALPTVVFLLMGFLSGCSALFICEAMSNIRGNEEFQARVEFTTIAQLFLGKRYHVALQFLLYLSMQSVNIASMIISVQTLDDMFIAIFKKTCGLGFSPAGWICVTEQTANNSPFPSGSYFFFTFGLLATAILVVPLGFFNLVENVKVQIGSFILLIAILVEWIISFGIHGFDTSNLPAASENSGQVVGTVLLNYAFITTVPSWINDVRRDVSIHMCIWLSLFTSCFFYIIIGVTGAMSYSMGGSSNILDFLRTDGLITSKIAVYMFPLVALVTSVPVFTIVIRSNLLRGQVCGKYWAHFLASGAPWLVVIVLQTSDWLNMFLNWTSLFLQSTVNFILPFALYFISKRYEAKIKDLPSPEAPIDTDVFVMYNPEENRAISIQRTPSTNVSHITDSSKVDDPNGHDMTMVAVPHKDHGEISPPHIIPDIILTDTNKSYEQSLHDPGDTNTGDFLKIPNDPPAVHSENSMAGERKGDRNIASNYANSTALEIDHKVSSDHDEQSRMPRSRGHSVTLSIETGNLSNHIRRRSGASSPNHSLAIVNVDPSSPSTLHTTSITSTPSSPTNPFPIFNNVRLRTRFRAFPGLGSTNSFILAILAFILITLAVGFTIIYDFVLLGTGNNVYNF